jgi:dTMP kinase
MHGKFISIEGIEGAGKSTQIAFIESYLTAQNKAVVLSREPGGTALGEQIRSLLLTPRDEGISDDAELLLMFAARAEHIAQVIRPALARGDWVICDRFVEATFAYQGGGRGIAPRRITQIADWTLQGLTTDLTLLFDLPVALGLSRVASRNEATDRFEQEKADFFEKVRANYLSQAHAKPSRIKIIDASHSLEKVQQSVATELNHLLEHE